MNIIDNIVMLPQDITVTNSTQAISNEFNKQEIAKLIIKKGQCLIFLHK